MVNADKLITDHLSLWSSTIKARKTTGRGSNKKRELYGIKKLRELIRELAVRGLLVPQDANDEPASEQLKRISSEKVELLKKSRTKKEKPLPVENEADIRFPTPNKWAWVYLGNISVIERGGSPRPIKSYITEADDGLNWIKIGDTDMTGKYIKSTAEKIRPEGLAKTRKVYPGDFLLTNSMSFGRPYITQIEGCIHDGWLRICPPTDVSKDYLYLLLTSPYAKNSFKESASGAVVQNLNSEKVRQLLIPLPPLAEQHRIVAKVDELMALCDKLEQQQEDSIDTHQTLVKSLLDALTTTADPAQFQQAWQRIEVNFHTLFTTESSVDHLKQTILQLAVMGKLVPQDPNDEPASQLLKKIALEKEQLIKDKKIKKQKPLPTPKAEDLNTSFPNHWEFCTLNDLILFMDAGWSPACPPTPSPSNKVWGVLKTTAVQQMKYLEFENKMLDEVKEPRPQYEVKKGDILITRAGPKNRVGVSCLVKETRPKLMISDKIIRFHLLNDSIDEEYITLCLNSGITADHLESSKSGMAESQMNISQGKLQAAPVPLPPTSEQRRIIAKVDSLMTLCDTLKANLQCAQTTQQTLTDTIVEQATV